MVEALKEARSKVKYTEFAGEGHGVAGRSTAMRRCTSGFSHSPGNRVEATGPAPASRESDSDSWSRRTGTLFEKERLC